MLKMEIETLKIMTKFEKLCIRLEKEAQRIISENINIEDERFKKVASKIETSGGVNLRHYDELKLYYIELERKLLKEQSTERGLTFKQIEVIKALIETVKEVRKVKNRERSQKAAKSSAKNPLSMKPNRSLETFSKTSREFVRRGIQHIYYRGFLVDSLSASDLKLLFVLYSLWEEQGLKEKMVFEPYDLQERLGIDEDSKQFEALKESYNKLVNTEVIVHTIKQIEKGREHIIDRYSLVGEDRFTFDVDKDGFLNRKPIEITFNKDSYYLLKNNDFPLINADLLLKISGLNGKLLYSLLSRLPQMPEFDLYWKEDKLVLPLEFLYKQLELTNEVDEKNKLAVVAAGDELKRLGIIEEYEVVPKRKHSTPSINIDLSSGIKGIAGYDELLEKRKKESIIEVSAEEVETKN